MIENCGVFVLDMLVQLIDIEGLTLNPAILVILVTEQKKKDNFESLEFSFDLKLSAT